MADFYSNLDDTGKKLYDQYQKSLKEWVEYIKPKLLDNLNSYLNSTGRYFDSYAYLNIKYPSITININNEQEYDTEIKKIYKSLSIIFHPDKFQNKHATNIFTRIGELYKDNQTIILINFLLCFLSKNNILIQSILI